MRTQSFNNFLKNYAKSMNSKHTLSLFKNEQFVKEDSRLLTVFTFYVLFNNDVAQYLFEKKDKLPKLYEEYNNYKNKYFGLELEFLGNYVQKLDKFDELSQLYTSYMNLIVNKRKTIKDSYYGVIKKLQREKRISSYRIYTDLKLNHGNTSDFIKNKNIGKLSLENIKRIQKYCLEYN